MKGKQMFSWMGDMDMKASWSRRSSKR